MAKDDTTAGLLSKVVKFVRNPTTNWGDLDQPETDREGSYSKQMLKEMIERKRRNDFVRKREFDMLRKMRRSEVMAGQDASARPSFFQSSMPSKPDDRATTLKKIDEIEAQMSMQWWKTKNNDSALRTGAGALQGPTHAAQEAPAGAAGGSTLKFNSYAKTGPQTLAPDLAATAPAPLPMLDFAAPDVNPPRAPPAVPVLASRPAPTSQRSPPALSFSAVTPSHAEASSPSSGFSASKMVAIDVDEFAHDPELEEASIRFANGDDTGAEAGLLEVLGPKGPRLKHDETWLTLFDLYRAIGQQERFESAAIDFAGRFSRSAPQWFSMPEAVRLINAPTSLAPSSGSNQIANWTSPSTFGTQTLAALNAALAKATPPWRLNWSKLGKVEDAAVEGLSRLFTQWAAEPVQLRFIGGDTLEKVLKEATPSGDKATEPGWWKLRMEVLRVMHRPDEFELVALDYCVTYEVSPPSWDSARGDYKPLQADGTYVPGHTILGEAFSDSAALGQSTGFGETQTAPLNSQMSYMRTVELTGQILGDAPDVPAMLDRKLAGADVMVISCARLIRIDFSAAGTLLNWVTARQAEGHQVQFVDVHRLVAAFFNVIGISEHARVSARTD
jgi:ABC-type transporter Mla MlaB component